jgi:fructose-1,6-bisphosphatase I
VIVFAQTSVLYEVFPMSFLMEQAGGQAFTGKQRVLTSSLFLLLSCLTT